MSNLCFRLREGKKIDLLHTSDIKVDISKWDNKSATLINSNTINKAEFEKQVSERKTIINYVFEKLDKNNINNASFNHAIDEVLHPERYKRIQAIDSLLEFIKLFIKEAPNRKIKNTDRLLSYNNIQQYRATEKHLKNFAKSKSKKDFCFNDIDQLFYDGFVTYLQSEILGIDEKEKPVPQEQTKPVLIKTSFTANSVGKHIRILKLILNEATSQGYNSSNYYKSFHVFNEYTDRVFLDEEELKQLKDLNLSKTSHLSYVRDLFLLLAWTGLRYIDLEKIGKTDIIDGCISFRQDKTNTLSIRPLHPVVLEILEKYNFELHMPISNHKFNLYIKEIGKLANINTTETTTVTKGEKKHSEYFEKWQLISTHTGRLSFYKNMYKRGLSTTMLMSISGHKSEKSFLKYINVKQSEHDEIIKKMWTEICK